MCSTLRRAARALTQLYEAAVRPLGLRATQFTILQVLSLAGEVTQGQLGRILAMDSTTLTRTLKIMLRHGWLTERSGKDRRVRRLRLANKGAVQLRRALPHWQRVQAQVRAALGGAGWEQLMKLSNDVTHSVTK
jgi:DNA-binding MarR family transcriptional regulator